MIPNPTQSNVFTALRSFLLSVLPPGVDVLRSQVNRVSETNAPDFVMMTPIRQDRIETNVDTYADCLFTASITGNVMSVSQVQFGAITVGAQLFSPSLLTGTLTVVGLVTGTGGLGTYTVSGSVTLSNQTIAAGLMTLMQPVEWTIQLDVHGPNSGDNSVVITTAFRDEYATLQFQTSGFDVAPLYADEAKQVPFINENEQFEDRWVIEACLQANQTITVSQQFTQLLNVNLIEVL